MRDASLFTSRRTIKLVRNIRRRPASATRGEAMGTLPAPNLILFKPLAARCGLAGPRPPSPPLYGFV